MHKTSYDAKLTKKQTFLYEERSADCVDLVLDKQRKIGASIRGGYLRLRYPYLAYLGIVHVSNNRTLK